MQNYYIFLKYENNSYNFLHFVTSNYHFALFAPKISGNLSPSLGVPLVYGGRPGVIVQPHFRFPHHVEEVLVGGIPFYFGLAAFLAQPCQSGDAISIDDPIEVIFLDIRESEDERQELADVVRALHKRPAVKDLSAGIGNDAPELHDARIAAARSIHRQCR